VEGYFMTAGNIVFLCIAVGGITLFGAVLAWASWMEGRAKKPKSARRLADVSKQTNRVGRIPTAHPAPKILSRPF
jgi:hypothetical protein